MASELDEGALKRRYDLVVAAVPHAEYRLLAAEDVRRLAKEGGCIANIKGIWRGLDLGPGVDRWTL